MIAKALTHIVIAEDQTLLRRTLVTQLNAVPGLTVDFEADTGLALMDYIKAAAQLPQVLLLDISLPVINGLEICKMLSQDFPRIKIVVLSVHQQESLIVKMITGGASAYLNKNCDFSELVQAIQAVVNHDFYMNAAMFKALQGNHSRRIQEFRAHNQVIVDLSPREIEVLLLICREFSSAEIAERLFISIRTAEGHRNRLLSKTGSRNTAGLVLFAVKNHILEIV